MLAWTFSRRGFWYLSKNVARSRIDNVFPSLENCSDAELEKLYDDYARTCGDSEAPADVSARHGKWVLVGQNAPKNSYCGTWQKHKACLRTELHNQRGLDLVSHSKQVYWRNVHRFCDSPLCSVCFRYGWARRLADHATQRIFEASKRFGKPDHIIVSPPQSDWNLFEFHNEKYRAKVNKLLYSLGVVGGCQLLHAFRYASSQEALDKGVLQGFYWSPHSHLVAFILDYKCRRCPKLYKASEVNCAGCDGFENRVRHSYKDWKYIIKVKEERVSVFGTLYYEASHASVMVEGSR